MDGYQYLLFPSLSFPTLYYLSFPQGQQPEPTLPETQTALSPP